MKKSPTWTPVTIDSAACGTTGKCFTYDALGRLVEKNIRGNYTQILYGPGGKLGIMNAKRWSACTFHCPEEQRSIWPREATDSGTKIG
jgi:hypothetical protein